MMINFYSVLDKTAEQYGQPLMFNNDGVAIRAFHMECTNEKSPIYAFPEDYCLCKCGSFNSDTGEVTPLEPKVICRGLDFVRKENK